MNTQTVEVGARIGRLVLPPHLEGYIVGACIFAVLCPALGVATGLGRNFARREDYPKKQTIPGLAKRYGLIGLAFGVFFVALFLTSYHLAWVDYRRQVAAIELEQGQ